MKRFFITVFLLLICFSFLVAKTDAQQFHTISGTVRDNDTQNILGGVTVAAGSAVTSTDIAGYFSLTVPAGIYQVQCQLSGYQTATVSVDVRTNDTYLSVFMIKEKAPSGPTKPALYDAQFQFESAYVPTRVVVQYQYTVNFSISSVQTLGQSLWTATVGPVGIEFNAKDVDSYEFDVTLLYGDIVDQVIQVVMWSGMLAPTSIPIHFKQKTIYLHFKLVCTEQPRPPTAEEVAVSVEALTRQDLQNYMDQVKILTDQFQTNLITQWVIIGALVTFGVASLITSVYTLRAKRREG